MDHILRLKTQIQKPIVVAERVSLYKMLIGSFNVNSINARLKNIVDYIEEYKLDIILLQKLKTINENFPCEPFKKLGYNIVTNCQKSYNGVAILSQI